MGKKIYFGNTGLAKFGRSGNEGKTLAFYLNDNGTWEGIPFGHVRGSNAYEENNGILTEVGIDVPRFQDGKYFTEGESVELSGYTNQFEDWVKSNTTSDDNVELGIDNKISASKIQDNTTNGIHRVVRSVSLLANTKYLLSVNAKADTLSNIQLALRNTSNSATESIVFDIENGVFGEQISSGSGTVHEYGVKQMGNGFYRVWVLAELFSTPNTLQVTLADKTTGNTTTLNQVTYSGDGNGSVFLTQFNCVQEETLTSVIDNNTGVNGTRQADTGIQSLVDLSEQINSEEGVIVINSKTPNETGVKRIMVNNGSAFNNALDFRYQDNIIQVRVYENGFSKAVMTVNDVDIKEQHEIAFKYKSGESTIWVDGILKSTSTDSFILPTNILSAILFSNENNSGSYFIGEVDSLTLYPSIAEAQQDLPYIQ